MSVDNGFLGMLKAQQTFDNSHNNAILFLEWVTDDKQARPLHPSFDYPFLKLGDPSSPINILRKY